MSKPMHLLHLSDLHFGTPEDGAPWYSALAQDLKNGLGCDRLDALILSGDIGTFSTLDNCSISFLEN